MRSLAEYVEAEISLARACADPKTAFSHLERAHILSQYSTRDHVRVHTAMLCWAKVQRNPREMLGQILRLVGAATKMAIGWVPTGNTGGSNVSAIKPMPVPPDLAEIIALNR